MVCPERGSSVSGALNVSVYINASYCRVLVRCARCAWRMGRISMFLLIRGPKQRSESHFEIQGERDTVMQGILRTSAVRFVEAVADQLFNSFMKG